MHIKYCESSVGCGKKIGPRLQSGFNGSNGFDVDGVGVDGCGDDGDDGGGCGDDGGGGVGDDGVIDGLVELVGGSVGVSPHVTKDAQLQTSITGSKRSPSSHLIKAGTSYSH